MRLGCNIKTRHISEEVVDGAEVCGAHRSVCAPHFMTLDVNAFGCRPPAAELYHNSEDCGRKENVSGEHLCGIHPPHGCRGEVHLKELPFPALLLQAWPMTKNTILFFLLSLPPRPDSWTLYCWNVMLGSFAFAQNLPSVHRGGRVNTLSHWALVSYHRW